MSEDVLVECRSSAEYAEHPTALHWQGRRIEIAQVVARWRTPQGKGFRVVAGDKQFFELFYNVVDDTWSIHPL